MRHHFSWKSASSQEGTYVASGYDRMNKHIIYLEFRSSLVERLAFTILSLVYTKHPSLLSVLRLDIGT